MNCRDIQITSKRPPLITILSPSTCFISKIFILIHCVSPKSPPHGLFWCLPWRFKEDLKVKFELQLQMLINSEHIIVIVLTNWISLYALNNKILMEGGGGGGGGERREKLSGSGIKKCLQEGRWFSSYSNLTINISINHNAFMHLNFRHSCSNTFLLSKKKILLVIKGINH